MDPKGDYIGLHTYMGLYSGYVGIMEGKENGGYYSGVI